MSALSSAYGLSDASAFFSASRNRAYWYGSSGDRLGLRVIPMNNNRSPQISSSRKISNCAFCFSGTAARTARCMNPASVGLGETAITSPVPSRHSGISSPEHCSELTDLPPPPFLVAGAGSLLWNPLALAQGLSGPCLTLTLVQPLPVSLPDIVALQPVSALRQPSASTTNNHTSWQSRSINDLADSRRYPARKSRYG